MALSPAQDDAKVGKVRRSLTQELGEGQVAAVVGGPEELYQAAATWNVVPAGLSELCSL